MVTDLITKKPVANATLTAGPNSAVTDETGTASITVPTATKIHISASWYLPANITPTSDNITATLIPIWLIAAGAGGAAAIVIGVAFSGSSGGKK